MGGRRSGCCPGLGAWLALLVAAALAPTDAALGVPVVTNPAVPARVRRMLTVESGLNDGIATPVVLLAIAGAAATEGVTRPSSTIRRGAPDAYGSPSDARPDRPHPARPGEAVPRSSRHARSSTGRRRWGITPAGGLLAHMPGAAVGEWDELQPVDRDDARGALLVQFLQSHRWTELSLTSLCEHLLVQLDVAT